MRISDWSSDVCSSDLERQLAVLEFQRPFEQMSRRAFVIGEGGKRIARPFGGIAQVDEEDAGARAVGGARLRRPARRADLNLGRHAADFIGRLRHTAEYLRQPVRSEEHTSELQSLMRTSYAVFCLQKK